MKKIFLIFFILLTTFVEAQNGETILYFKNGNTVVGTGFLKGEKYINFKKENTSKKVKFSFDIIDKADIKLNDSVTITYRLFPITDKNGKPKENSVLGELVSGNVSLYVKGSIKDVSKLPHSNMANHFGGVTGFKNSGVVHYFIRKQGQENAVHLNSSQYTIRQLLNGVGLVFSDCPEVYQYMLTITEHVKSLNEAIEYYNKKCAE